SDHVANAQIFQRNRVKTAYQFGTQLMQEVLALVGDVFLLALDGKQLLSSVLAAAFGPRQLALQPAQLLLTGAVVVRVGNLFAVAGRDKRRYAHVDTDDAPRRWQGFRRGNFTGKAGVPLARLANDAYRLNRAFNRPVPADSHAPDAGQLQPPPINRKAVAVLFQTKAVEPTLPLEARIARLLACLDTAKERLKRLVEVGNRHLQDVAMHVPRLREGALVVFDLSQLLGFGDAAPFQFPLPLPLGKAHVVEVAGAIQRLLKPLLLSAGRVQ